MADKRLQVFHTVAKLLSFTKAADVLQMTQPAVTFQIRQLEESYNVRLFDRSHNRIDLTEAGRRMFEYSERLFELYREMENSIREVTGNVSGSLRIGATVSIGDYVLPKLLVAFKQNFPDVNIQLKLADTSSISSMVEKAIDDFNFSLIKNILLINKSNSSHESAHNNITSTKEKDLDKFKVAYSLLLHDEYKKSQKIFLELSKAHPKNIVISSLLAETYKSDLNQALKVLDKQLENHPQNIPLTIQYSKIALKNNQALKAIVRLKSVAKTNHNCPEIDLLLANSYNHLKQKWQANLAYANYSVKKGDLSAAMMQLKASKKFDKLSDYQQKVLAHKLKELESKYELRKEKLKDWL